MVVATVERRRTRIATPVTADAWDEAQIEVQSLRDELRALGRLSPAANRVHAYVALVGDSIEAEQLAAAVAAYLARAARRHP